MTTLTRRCVRSRSARLTPHEAFGYGDPFGAPELREVLARYLRRARGVQADPERIVVCAGHAHATALLAHVMAARGMMQTAFENPSLWVFRDIAVACGQHVVAAAVDDLGVVVSGLDAPAVVAGTWVGPVRHAMAAQGWRGQALGQLVLAEFLHSGGYDRHVRRMCARYRRRRDRLLAALPPALWVSGIAAGLHVVVELPAAGPTEQQVIAAARRHSVDLETLGPSWMNTRKAWWSATPHRPNTPMSHQ